MGRCSLSCVSRCPARRRATLIAGPTNTIFRPPIAALLPLEAHGGLRVSEALALRWEALDLAAQALTVRQDKGRKQRRVAVGESRTVALEPVRLSIKWSDKGLGRRMAGWWFAVLSKSIGGKTVRRRIDIDFPGFLSP